MQSVGGQEDGPRVSELLHACCEVRRLADRRVIHREVATDGAHHDLTGVQSHADLDLEAV
jgi:hypothetical protein